MSVAELLSLVTRLGIRLEARGDRLRFYPRSAVTPDLERWMKLLKADVLAVLRADDRPGSGIGMGEADLPMIGSDGWPDNTVVPPEPCPACGTLELWQSLAGNWRCMRCEPPQKSIEVLTAVERLRRRHGIPSPPGAEEMLADLKQRSDT